MDFSLSGRTNSLSSKGLLQLEGTYRYLQSPTKSLTAEAQYDVELGDANQHLKVSLKVDEFNLDTTFDISLKKGNELDTKFVGKFLEHSMDLELDVKYVWNENLKEIILNNNIEVSWSDKASILKHFRLTKEDFLFEDIITTTTSNFLRKLYWKFGESLKWTDNYNLETKKISQTLEITKVSPFSYDIKVIVLFIFSQK